MARSFVLYVDVDDTFVRSSSHARLPMPEVLGAIRRLHREGATLYCWSSGGGEYARQSAEEFGVADCFVAFLPKPDVLIDDVAIADWRQLRHVHPNAVSELRLLER
ncbi:MAG: hydrolase [Bacteroidota bacterium]